MTKYDLDSLIESLLKHHEKAQKVFIDQVERFKRDYPDTELPEHFKENFSLPKVLHVICKEIKDLKDK